MAVTPLKVSDQVIRVLVREKLRQEKLIIAWTLQICTEQYEISFAKDILATQEMWKTFWSWQKSLLLVENQHCSSPSKHYPHSEAWWW